MVLDVRRRERRKERRYSFNSLGKLRNEPSTGLQKLSLFDLVHPRRFFPRPPRNRNLYTEVSTCYFYF